MSPRRPVVDARGHLARWALLAAVAGVAALTFPGTGAPSVRALPLDDAPLTPREVARVKAESAGIRGGMRHRRVDSSVATGGIPGATASVAR